METQKQVYEDKLTLIGETVKRLKAENRLLVQNQLNMQQYDSINSALESKMRLPHA